MAPSQPLYLIDASSYIYRAFYAVKALSSPAGLPTNAIFGFLQMLLKVLKDEAPRYLCVVFDSPEPTFRHQLYPDYKATRQRMPEDLARQLPYIKQLVNGHGLAGVELAGYEADDLIATLAVSARSRGVPVVIVSADKDLHQLVEDPWIVQWDTQRERRFDAAEVVARLGVAPERVLDLLALMGDSSDHIPGVPGVGMKTALKLLGEWGSLDGVYAHLDRVAAAGIRRKLEAHRDLAYLSKDLVTLKTDAPIALELDAFQPRPPDRPELIRIYDQLGFKSLAEPLRQPVAPGEDPSGGRAGAGRIDHLIDSEASWQRLLGDLAGQDRISIDLETTSKDPMRAAIVGIALCWKDHEACYLPLAHSGPGSTSQLARDRVLEALAPYLSSRRPQKIGQNLKYEWLVLHRHGIDLNGIGFDTMVAAYLLEPGEHSQGLERLAGAHLGERLISYEEVTGKGKNQIGFAQVPVDQAAAYACEDAEVTWRLRTVLAAKLEAEAELLELYRELELPLVPVLARMELAGVLVDRVRLGELSRELERGMAAKAAAVYELAGGPFNIQSPKQLGDVLFGKLQLPVLRKTKTGPSTDMNTLEVLAVEHPIADMVLAYRSLAKLKGTYADALPQLIHPETGRIHTSFNQTVTATGRLSSSDPNLQNIPIRTEEGRRIRAAFIAAPGHLLLSADYSQIELRVLAHFSGDEHLRAAFQEDADVHRRTAAEMFGIPPHEVTPEMRRQAKAINFGIIYGMGAFGLARQLGTGTSSARAAIERYFDRYAGVKRFIQEVIEETRSRGHCRTLAGRRRAIPELSSRNQTIRAQGERLAVNTTIQGSAADLIKRAMLDIDRELRVRRLGTLMLLQVHDELVFEVPEKELDLVRDLVRDSMEQVQTLTVPLKVDLAWGVNWAEAHA